MGGDDKVGTGSDLGCDHQLWIGLDFDFDTGLSRCDREPVIRVRDHHPNDIDAMRAKRVQGGNAKMSRADKGNAHGSCSVVGQLLLALTGRGAATPHRERLQR